MGEKLSKAPVYFTIAQVRFNSIQKMDSFAPDIQEKFRKVSFSDAQTISLNGLDFGFATVGNSLNPPVPVRQSLHIYSNFEKTECFILDQSSLTFQTTEYGDFQSFSETFLRGLKIVDQVIGGIDFVDRIGLRYLNAFQAENGKHITYSLNPKIVGTFDNPEMQISHSFVETAYIRNRKNVLARTIIMNGQFNFPLDIQLGALRLSKRLNDISGEHATLDIDSSTSVRQKFDIASVSIELRLIHDEIEYSFNRIVSPSALENWKTDLT